MAKRNKTKRIAFLRRQATTLANVVGYYEAGRMTERKLLEDVLSIARALLREVERKETESQAA